MGLCIHTNVGEMRAWGSARAMYSMQEVEAEQTCHSARIQSETPAIALPMRDTHLRLLPYFQNIFAFNEPTLKMLS